MSKDSKAIKQKGKLLSFNPTGEYYFAKGLKAYQRRDFYKSKKFLERATQLESTEPMIYCQLAIVCTELGEYQQSNVYLHEILEELDEHMLECHYFLANNYAHLGLFKDAYTHAQTYLKLDPEGEFVEDTEDLLDLLMLEAEELDEDLYEEDDLIVKQEEARRLLEAGQFTKAAELLEEVIKAYPEYWSAYNNLALAYFYLGKPQKADAILEDVLSKNNGNLHALCNKLVFAHYQNDMQQVQVLRDSLMKVKPILVEHQYKLGASFALVGEYELALAWLRKLQKKGFEGDGPFYYWLSHSAFHMGNENLAHQAWKRVLELSPEKDGHAPWEKLEVVETGMETIAQASLESDMVAERLYGIFLSELNGDVEEMGDFYPRSLPEDVYWAYLKQSEMVEERGQAIHDTALALAEHHSPEDETPLFLEWFTVAEQMVNEDKKMVSPTGLAAATEYLWRKEHGEKVSQSQMGKQYGLSSSTLQKYVKLIKGLYS